MEKELIELYQNFTYDVTECGCKNHTDNDLSFENFMVWLIAKEENK